MRRLFIFVYEFQSRIQKHLSFLATTARDTLHTERRIIVGGSWRS